LQGDTGASEQALQDPGSLWLRVLSRWSRESAGTQVDRTLLLLLVPLAHL
jgi:hypothetical protein